MARKKIGGIYIDLDAQTVQFDKKLSAAGRTIGVTEARFESLARSAKWATAGIAAAVGLMAKRSIGMAMDVTEAENLFTVSMGRMADAAKDWSVELSKSLGLNQYELRKQIGTVNQMFTAMGMAGDQAFGLGKQFVELAQDMASFYNLRPEEAFQKLQAGITGEAEPLKRLGVLVDETTTKTFAMAQGLRKNWSEVSQAEKVYWRFQSILAQTANAQGDLARTLDSPTNRIRKLQARFDELTTTVGIQFLDAFARALDQVDALVPRVEALAKELAPRLAQAAMSAMDAMGRMASLFGALPDSFKSAAVQVGLMAGAVWLLVPALSALKSASLWLAANPLTIPLAAGAAALTAGAAQFAKSQEDFESLVRSKTNRMPTYLPKLDESGNLVMREEQAQIRQVTEALKKLRDLEAKPVDLKSLQLTQADLAGPKAALDFSAGVKDPPEPTEWQKYFAKLVDDARESVTRIREYWRLVDEGRTEVERSLGREGMAKVLGLDARDDLFGELKTRFQTAFRDLSATMGETMKSAYDRLDETAVAATSRLVGYWSDVTAKIRESRDTVLQLSRVMERQRPPDQSVAIMAPNAKRTVQRPEGYENLVRGMEYAAEATTGFREHFSQQMSLVRNDFARTFADAIVQARGWAETMDSIVKNFASTALRVLTERLFDKLAGKMAGLGGAGGGGDIFGSILSGVLSFIPGVGGLIGGLFGKVFGGAPKSMKLARGGIVKSPAFGWTANGQPFEMAEAGAEYVVPAQVMEGLIERASSAMAGATVSWPRWSAYSGPSHVEAADLPRGYGRDGMVEALLAELRRIKSMPAGQVVRSAVDTDGPENLFRGAGRQRLRRLAFNEY